MYERAKKCIHFLPKLGVMFDVSGSFIPSDTTTRTPLFFLLQLGERDALGHPVWATFDATTPVDELHMPKHLTYAYAYARSGRKAVNVTVSDQAFTVGALGTVPTGLLLSGKPAPVAKTEFDIFESSGRPSFVIYERLKLD